MLFGFFKKSKTPLEEFKLLLNNFQTIMERDEKEKGLIESKIYIKQKFKLQLTKLHEV
jgi:hypothetical protein